MMPKYFRDTLQICNQHTETVSMHIILFLIYNSFTFPTFHNCDTMMIQANQRVRLPSVNDIFPTHSPYHAPITHRPIVISTHDLPYSPISPLQTPNPIASTPPQVYSMDPYPYYIPQKQQIPQQHPIYYVHYNPKDYKIQKNSSTRQSNAWTYEDDCLLKYLKEVRNLGWREISMHFKSRTANGCQFRWRRIASIAKVSTDKKTLKNESRSNSLDRILN